ncbi:hypothetical protein EBS57_07595 [bacterium]|nr:hypothetical protein [bacterium]
MEEEAERAMSILLPLGQVKMVVRVAEAVGAQDLEGTALQARVITVEQVMEVKAGLKQAAGEVAQQPQVLLIVTQATVEQGLRHSQHGLQLQAREYQDIMQVEAEQEQILVHQAVAQVVEVVEVGEVLLPQRRQELLTQVVVVVEDEDSAVRVELLVDRV